ncbi:unnamed protein product [Phytophthora fragariaefolia]|uniref:Unnamed protein product n=1 Tax=Phytophthora fragariaefolia TaxID=1490495 RepID=A0A9W6UFA8_9STRA|nr:unnamed protein product [Phytophthora fragariaefolia]
MYTNASPSLYLANGTIGNIAGLKNAANGRIQVGVPSENGPYRSSGIRPRSGSPGEQLFEAEPRMGR